jgi:deazaflavin-dependent oxidoreductase (nitroreductase family)
LTVEAYRHHALTFKSGRLQWRRARPEAAGLGEKVAGFVTDAGQYDRRIIAEFRARGGVAGGELQGLSLLLLHHTGAKSGAERITPLAYWPVTGTSVAVVASNFGAPRHPAWFYNLIANPAALAEIGSVTWAVRARVTASGERRELIDRISRSSPAVAAAVARTARPIPVVILDLLGRPDHDSR